MDMDYGASNHMFGTTYLFNSHGNKNYTEHKVSISDGNHILVLGFGNVNVPNGTLEDLFHVQGIPINLLSIYRACQWVINLKLSRISVCLKISNITSKLFLLVLLIIILDYVSFNKHYKPNNQGSTSNDDASNMVSN